MSLLGAALSIGSGGSKGGGIVGKVASTVLGGSIVGRLASTVLGSGTSTSAATPASSPQASPGGNSVGSSIAKLGTNNGTPIDLTGQYLNARGLGSNIGGLDSGASVMANLSNAPGMVGEMMGAMQNNSSFTGMAEDLGTNLYSTGNQANSNPPKFGLGF